ncbi:MAG TPA: PaaI family thioesterase [Terriglobales bacterium]|nr:PaaI family thioesterase [Terriglobales bacterium]
MKLPVIDKSEIIRESFARQGLMGTIGAEISSLEHGRIEIRFGFQPGLTQQNGFVHAGVITSVMDSGCGYAALSVSPENYDVLSVEFKVNLLAPAAGESFVVRAEVKRAGRTLTVSSADAFAISGGEEKLIATMLATMFNLPPKG